MNAGAARRKAYQQIQRAIRRGELVKPKRCPVCGGKGRRIEAHHEDDANPLDVEWMCSACHGQTRQGIRTIVGPELWRDVRAKAKREGVSLRALMLGLLAEWLKRPAGVD